MPEPSTPSGYLFDTIEEPLRLERQARLYGLEHDLRRLVEQRYTLARATSSDLAKRVIGIWSPRLFPSRNPSIAFCELIRHGDQSMLDAAAE